MILLTGGTGLLGKELKKLLGIECIAPTHKEFDILKFKKLPGNDIHLIVHCAAYTDVARAEMERLKCYLTNVIGTRKLADTKIPMIYLSTEYVFDGERGNYREDDYLGPKNYYAFTKALGEFEARRTNGVIIRTCFKPRPFEHAAACIDQYTSGDYVNVIAEDIALIVRNWKIMPQVIHIGTGRKSVYNLATKTRDVIPISIKTIGVQLPRDTSLNTSLWEKIRRGL